MAAKNKVVLISPEGEETTVTDPVAINNLVYGAGYRHKDPAKDDQPTTAQSTTARDRK